MEHNSTSWFLDYIFWAQGGEFLRAMYLASMIVSLLLLVYGAHSVIGLFTAIAIQCVRDSTNGCLESLKRAHRWSYIFNFFVVNYMVFMSIAFMVIIYEIDFTMIIYTIGSIAILISVFCGTIYVPYLESFKIVFSGRIEYGKTYDLMISGKVVYENYKVHRIYTFTIVWKTPEGKCVSMPVGRLNSMDIVAKQ